MVARALSTREEPRSDLGSSLRRLCGAAVDTWKVVSASVRQGCDVGSGARQLEIARSAVGCMAARGRFAGARPRARDLDCSRAPDASYEIGDGSRGAATYGVATLRFHVGHGRPQAAATKGCPDRRRHYQGAHTACRSGPPKTRPATCRCASFRARADSRVLPSRMPARALRRCCVLGRRRRQARAVTAQCRICPSPPSAGITCTSASRPPRSAPARGATLHSPRISAPSRNVHLRSRVQRLRPCPIASGRRA